MEFGFSPEQQRFLEAARAFARDRVEPAAAGIDESGRYPRELVVEAGERGLLGVCVSRGFGGAARDYVAYAAAVEAIAQASATLAVILSVSNSLVAEPIEAFGTEAQKAAWLPRLTRGEAIGAFALSEAQSGSDAANVRTVAVADGDAYLVSGRKVWVANAHASELAVVFAATAPGAGRDGITALLVELGLPGVSREASPDSLGVRGLGCMDLCFDRARVPATAVLGAPGGGFGIAMRALDGGRVAIAAQSLGVGHAALDEALRYSRRRQAFGQPIGNFQAIQFQLADLATDLEAARMLTWKAADAHDRAGHATVEAAMAKLQASEAAHRAADRALQILASEGYRRGSTVERLFRDARAAEIYQGTSEVQRLIIARQVLGSGGRDRGAEGRKPA
jgi:alkylation response protein AidB-like acyl-CoA dehydrogenase